MSRHDCCDIQRPLHGFQGCYVGARSAFQQHGWYTRGHEKIPCPGHFGIWNIDDSVPWRIAWTKMPEFHDLAAQINGTIVIENDVWLTPRRAICQYILIATHIGKAHLFF